MPKHKLLVVVTLLSAAPVSALPAAPGSRHDSDCPYARAAAAAAATGQTVTIESAVPAGSVLVGAQQSAAYLP